MVDEVIAGAAEAVADIRDGASLAVGGFGLSGIPVGEAGVVLRELAPGVSVEQVRSSTGAALTLAPHLVHHEGATS